MRPLWKDILAAVWIGMILPGIMLNIFVWKQRQREPDQLPILQGQPVQKSGNSIIVRNPEGVRTDMDLDTYLTGVLLAEIPAGFQEEALKAQAVAARTYAWKAHTKGGKHQDSSVCVDASCCQAYIREADYLSRGGNPEHLEKVRRSVLSTSGMVLFYAGEPIEATYFSCSGGSTEDAAAVWGADVPYLQAVASPVEENTKHFVTTTKLPVSDFSGRLGVNLSDGGIGQPVYTAGGGIQTINIGGKDFTGVQLRSLLGLKSTAIQMSVVGDQVVITTKGYGHRVGMSQYGADAMAVAGSTYEQILAHYYPGTALCSYRDLTKGN